jgi:hypothetical protein
LVKITLTHYATWWYSALQVIAADLLALGSTQLNTAVTEGKLLEICHDH